MLKIIVIGVLILLYILIVAAVNGNLFSVILFACIIIFVIRRIFGGFLAAILDKGFKELFFGLAVLIVVILKFSDIFLF